MKIIAELHTHTSDVCSHADGTAEEYAKLVRENGMKYLASTNHGPFCDDTPLSYYLSNREKAFEGITFLAGVEADLKDMKGNTDFAPGDLLKLDFVISSMHTYAMEIYHGDYTAALVAAAENPAIDCLGHIAREVDYFPVSDYRAVCRAVKENNKLIELNNWTVWSFGGGERVGNVMDICAETGVQVVVTSDAHNCERIGLYDHVFKVMEEHKFPEELVVNADEKKMADFLARRRAEKDAARAELFRR